MRKYKGLSTRAVHSGDQLDSKYGAVNTAIYQTSTFDFPTSDPRTWEGEVPDGSYIYTRYSNPTIRAVEDKLAVLEGGERGLVFSSGMAAISTALLTFLEKGDRVVSVEDIYGGTYNLMVNHLRKLGITVDFAPTTDTARLIDAITPGTKVVYLETPTNPLLKLIDVPAVAKAAHEAGAMVMIDNTFATPINQQPLEMGVDLVLHSCTKYLNGHTDLIAGAAIGRTADIEAMGRKRIVMGGALDPMGAFLLSRGIKTLAVRMERHNYNGLAIATYLESHSLVDKVHYPGLDSHPQHRLAERLMAAYGGMVSFEVKGGRKNAEKMMQRCQVVKMATSLGGVDSLISMPLNSSHAAVPPQERARLGIKDNLVRLSVGIEDVQDIADDLDQALRSA
jgi:cystathionine beta-lyase/cystathionine gamma-synthase